METTFIYALEDPRDSIPRYIGKSNDPDKRLRGHINEAARNTDKKRTDHKNNWIRSLLKDGIEPVVSILDEVPEAEWEFWETYYGHLFLSWGFDMVFVRKYLGIGSATRDMVLFNSTPKKKRIVSEAGKLKIKAAAKKRETNPTPAMLECRRKFGARELGIPSCTKGKKFSMDTKKKMSDAKRGAKAPWFGKHLTDETKAKLSAARLGKKATAETKAKLSAAQKKRYIEKGNPNIGRIQSEAEKEKRSEIGKKTWADPELRKQHSIRQKEAWKKKKKK
jgi:hypothetical protein